MPKPSEEFIKKARDRVAPWCDTCRMPAVWSEFHGMMHSTDDRPFGLPHSLDDSGHEVTMSEWNKFG